MSRYLLRAFVVSIALAVAPAAAQTSDTPAALTPQAIAELSLDELFEALPQHADSPPGRRIEVEIMKRFNRSGSDTADLLLSWANSAIESKNYPLALDILDQIVIIQPDFAEAWNKRATVHFLIDDYGASISDIRQTLALEPRHFAALAGLGMIFQAIDRKDDAIRVFERALKVNPQLDNVRKTMERLKLETAGESI